MPDRSVRIRVTLFALAFAALISAGLADLLALQANSHNSQVAVSDARAAADAARAAAVTAQEAAGEAAAARNDLCTFLNVIRTTAHADDREAQEAQRLYELYKCGT